MRRSSSSSHRRWSGVRSFWETAAARPAPAQPRRARRARAAAVAVFIVV